MTAIPLPLYQRLGSCEPKLCGSACCQFLTLEVNPIYAEQPDLVHWISLHGIELYEREKRVLARISIPCSALTTDGRCRLYGTDERPRVCADFPVTPVALLGVEDVCTFTFTGADPALLREAESTTEAP